jgi:hypothetical protein
MVKSLVSDTWKESQLKIRTPKCRGPNPKVPGSEPQSAGVRTPKCRVRTPKCRGPNPKVPGSEPQSAGSEPQSAGVRTPKCRGPNPKVPGVRTPKCPGRLPKLTRASLSTGPQSGQGVSPKVAAGLLKRSGIRGRPIDRNERRVASSPGPRPRLSTGTLTKRIGFNRPSAGSAAG